MSGPNPLPFTTLLTPGEPAGTLTAPGISPRASTPETTPPLAPSPGAPPPLPRRMLSQSTIPSPLIPAGFLPTSEGYALPPPRGLPVQLQTLAAGTNLLTGSIRAPFPFAVTAITYFAPAATAGGASDGKIAVGTAEQADLTVANAGQITNLTNIFGGAGFVYCPSPVSFTGLWLPVPAGHEYLYAQVLSQGGATNVFCVVLMTIVPLSDYIGS